MRRLIERHAGNLSAIAGELKLRGERISRQGLTLRLRRMVLDGGEMTTLEDLAASERAKAGVFGPRPRFPDGADPEGERQALVDALASTASPDEAAAKLGISRRSLYRRMEAHEILPAGVERRLSAG